MLIHPPLSLLNLFYPLYPHSPVILCSLNKEMPIWDSNLLWQICIVAPFITGSPQVSEGRHSLETFPADVWNGLPFLKEKGRSSAMRHGSRLDGLGTLCLSTPRPWNSTRGRGSRGQNPRFLLGRHFPLAIWETVWEA